MHGGKKRVPDDVMEAIRNEIHDGTNILYNYTIPLTIPILECILKRNELMIYKDSIYFISLILILNHSHTSRQRI